MSSAVSLVPTIKVATKKRRPTFRPAAAGSRKKPLQEKHVTIQVEEQGTSGPSAENEPPRYDEDVRNEAVGDETIEEQSQIPTDVPSQRRIHRSNKIAVAATRNADEIQVNDAKSKSKKEEEIAPGQTSLAT